MGRVNLGITGLMGPRGRVIAQTGAWSLVAKACAAANLFLSVPFVLHALGPVQFGAWATLVSFVAFAGFLDFGFSNGTMNLIAGARGREAPDEIATVLNEGWRAVRGVSIWLAVGAAVAIATIPWHLLLGLPITQSGTSREAAAVVLGTIVVAIPLNLATRAQLGLGRGDRAFRWQALGQLLALVVVIVCARAGASLPILTAVAVATPLVSALANTIDLHRSHLRSSSARERDVLVAGKIRHEGMLFFVLQLAAAIAFSADLPLISALRGPAEAGTYAIVQRLFSVIPLGLSLLWVPLWPSYRQALAARDHDWVVRTLHRSLLLAVMLASASAMVLALGFDRILHLWIHRPLAVGGWLLAGFALWCVIEAAGTAISTFLNAAGIMRYQVIVASVFATLCLVGKAWAVIHFGIAAMPWAAVITYSLVSLLPTLLSGSRLTAMALSKKY
jgi:O-antigen/teichoic acid export membrane protein